MTLVLELERLASADVDRPSTVRAALLLVLLLRESLAASDDQVVVGLLGVRIRHVGVGGVVVVGLLTEQRQWGGTGTSVLLRSRTIPGSRAGARRARALNRCRLVGVLKSSAGVAG